MDSAEDLDCFCISPEEQGIRIDKLLSERFPQYSRNYFQYLIEEGCVLINGELIKKKYLPNIGDEIEVIFRSLEQASLEPENIALDVLYEDEHLLVVNKPSGMVVHPAPGHWSGTFVNALLGHCQGTIESTDDCRPGIVHRLDKETSGVLVAAKTIEAHQKMVDLFAQRKVVKIYLTICMGRPTVKLVQASIGRHPLHRKKMSVVEGGKEATSELQVIAFNEQYSFVLVRPFTGRTHQIRVHLQHLGCPVLGDDTYGNPKLNHSLGIARHLLHAYRISFPHPVNGKVMTFSAPIPDDFKYWMRNLCGSFMLQGAGN